MLFNGSSPFLHFPSIFHTIQWAFYTCFILLSISHAMRWKRCICFHFSSIFILFNGNSLNLFIACQFPMFFNWNSSFSSSFCHFSLVFKPNQAGVPQCSTGQHSLWWRCPTYHHLHSQTYKAGQRVSLTTYCPWATGYVLDDKYEIFLHNLLHSTHPFN